MKRFVTAVVTALCCAGPAAAGGSVLQYESAAGQPNRVTVSRTGDEFRIRDTAAQVTQPAGCVVVGPNEVSCSASGITSLQIETGDGDDTIAQTTATPSLLDGGPGADVVTGGPAPDILEGGTGTDLASYATRNVSVAVFLDGVANDGALGEGDDVRTENVAGGTAADALTGSAGPNLLQGRAGNDFLTGNAGDDTLDGSGGDDRLIGAAGADVLNGNLGVDTADYAARAKPVTVRLDHQQNDGAANERDYVRATEIVIGGSAGDRITGDGGSNLLIGGPGDDVLEGWFGADTLRGLDGDDTLMARDGVADSSLECDAGADSAVLDALDPEPSDCETVSREG